MVMSAIFFFSSLPATRVPTFGAYDVYVKKLGHAIGYGMLGIAYYYALPSGLTRFIRWPMALSLALGFAVTDEIHQSFVAGRTSSLRDVAIDAFGATLALFLGAGYSNSIKLGRSRLQIPSSGLDSTRYPQTAPLAEQ